MLLNFSARLCPRFAYQRSDNVKMYKYSQFDQNILCCSKVMSIFTKIPQPAKMMLGKALNRHQFVCQWLDNVKINKDAKFDPNIPCGLSVMSICTN